MIRNIITVIGALFAGVVSISVVQQLNSLVFRPPTGMDIRNAEQLAQFIDQIPLGAMLGVELSYIVGSLACGVVVGFFAASHPRRIAIWMGVFFTIMNTANLMQIPHPLWMMVLTTITFIPVIWLAARWAAARRSAA